MNPDTAKHIARIESQIDQLHDEIRTIESGGFVDSERNRMLKYRQSKIAKLGKQLDELKTPAML